MKEQFWLVYAVSGVYDDYAPMLRSIPCGDIHGVVENMVKRQLNVGQDDVVVIRGERVNDAEINALLVPRRARYQKEQNEKHEAEERALYERLKAKFEREIENADG